jgi:hypothetical protein
MTTKHDEEEGRAPDSETCFESYFDRDSGAWSLRRVPSSPPAAGAEGLDESVESSS